MKKITSKTIIAKRDQLSKDITHYWNIMHHENIMPKSMVRNHDLHAVFKSIKDMANQRVQAKLQIQAINMGYKKISEMPTDNNYVNIYWLSEYKEIFNQLDPKKMRTLAPAKKKKAGNNITVSEIFVYSYVKKIRAEYQKKITEIEMKIAEFNDSAILEIEDEIETSTIEKMAA